MTDKPWYHEGLRFGCAGCGRCCTGDPGYVWVTKAEIQEMAAASGATVAEFESRFVQQVGIRKSLIERPNGDCIFFDGRERRCRVYQARPRQCRTWPFWQSNLGSPSRWKETCEACPGSGQGRLVPCEEIEDQIARMRV